MTHTSPTDTSADTDALVEALAPRVVARLVEMLGTPAPRSVDDDPLFNPREAAADLRRSTSTLEAWRAKGIGPDWVRIGAKSIAYRKSALDTFKRSRQRV